MVSGYRGGKYYSHLPSTPSTPSKPVGGGGSYSPSSASVPSTSSGGSSSTISSTYNQATRTATTDQPAAGSSAAMIAAGSQAVNQIAQKQAREALTGTADIGAPASGTYMIPSTRTVSGYETMVVSPAGTTPQEQAARILAAPSASSFVQSMGSNIQQGATYRINEPAMQTTTQNVYSSNLAAPKSSYNPFATTYQNPFTGVTGSNLKDISYKKTMTPSSIQSYTPKTNIFTGKPLTISERIKSKEQQLTTERLSGKKIGVSGYASIAGLGISSGIIGMGKGFTGLFTGKTEKGIYTLATSSEARSQLGTQLGISIRENPVGSFFNIATQAGAGKALGLGVNRVSTYIAPTTTREVGISLGTKTKEFPSIYEGSRTLETGAFATIQTKTTSFIDKILGRQGKTTTELVPMYAQTKLTPTLSTGLGTKGISFVETKFGNVKVDVPRELTPALKTQPKLTETIYMLEYGKRQGIASSAALSFPQRGIKELPTIGSATILTGKNLLTKPLSTEAARAGITKFNAREYGVPTTKPFNELLGNIDLGSPKVTRTDVYFRDISKAIGKPKPVNEIYQLSKSISIGELYSSKGKFLAGETGRHLAKTFIEPSRFRISTDIQPFILQEGKGLVTTTYRPTVGFNIPVAQELAKQVITPELPKVSIATPISTRAIPSIGISASISTNVKTTQANIRNVAMPKTFIAPTINAPSLGYEDIVYSSSRMMLPQPSITSPTSMSLISTIPTVLNREKIVTDYISKTKVDTSNLMKSMNTLKLSTPQITKVSTPQILKIPQLTKLKTLQITKTPQLQRLRTVSIPTPTPSTPIVPIPIIPIPFIPLPNFQSGFNDEAFARFVKPKKITRYTPSYTALVFNIRGKKPKGVETGLRIRPITKGFSFMNIMR